MFTFVLGIQSVDPLSKELYGEKKLCAVELRVRSASKVYRRQEWHKKRPRVT